MRIKTDESTKDDLNLYWIFDIANNYSEKITVIFGDNLNVNQFMFSWFVFIIFY